MKDSFFQSLEGAFAENTIRAYKADFKHFTTWCKAKDVSQADITADQMAEYIIEMGKSLSTATIRRRTASLGSLFKLMKRKDPTNEPEVILALKRLHRKYGRAQKQATPLTKEILKQLMEVCSDDLVGLRNKLLLQLGYETMRRRSEIVSFCVEDIHQLPNGRTALVLRSSKTDQHGEGKLIPITPSLHELINEWITKVGITKGGILRSFYRDGKTVKESLNPSSVSNILKALQAKAKLEIDDLSGHSFRVGAAIDLLDEGLSIEKIMLKGGWKSETTVIRYLRNWEAINFSR